MTLSEAAKVTLLLIRLLKEIFPKKWLFLLKYCETTSQKFMRGIYENDEVDQIATKIMASDNLTKHLNAYKHNT